MGHSSKKKKPRKSKGRAPSKDRSSYASDDQDLLSEELTALSAIFHDDFSLVSETPHSQFVINLRPHSNDMGYDDLPIRARLLVSCLPGYPHKCPKLRLIPEKDLTKDDGDRLFSLLLDQANTNAREGRVMIFNLVEAAQEFLSEVVPAEESHESVLCVGSGKNDQWFDEDAEILCSKSGYSEGPFVYGLFDLFSDLCGDGGLWDPALGTNVIDENHSKISREAAVVSKSSSTNLLVYAHKPVASNIGECDLEGHSFQNPKPLLVHDTKHDRIPHPFSKLNILKEEAEDDSKSISSKDSNASLEVNLFRKGSDNTVHEDQAEEDLNLREETLRNKGSDLENESLYPPSYVSMLHQNISPADKKDLVMVHLLRHACSSKELFAHALSEIASELHNTGLLSEWARDLAAEPPLAFNKAFEHSFQQHMTSSSVPEFWKASDSFSREDSSFPNSRYLNDFEEVRSLGHGGFGYVVLCKNKLDGRQYAIKKIRLKDKSLPVNDKILREVATLSRLQHQHVVRYYQAWFETEIGGFHGGTTGGSVTESSTFSYVGGSATNAIETENRQESTFLYIQMEYCPRTLRQDFETYTCLYDKDSTWHLFRQIVEGLAHIHSQEIIHRDLTPSNIFFDARNDIKIGDFGLAKFLKLEQRDQDQTFPTETTAVSIDGTGHVGTYFYTAPEIEHGWPQINEKVDMYSLGVVFFELWHPFATAMERYMVLSDLKQKGSLPPAWVAQFPEQSALVQLLMSPSPSNRPSAKELLQHALPPRMEDEWLNDILRTIHTAEDTYVYDRVVSTIFDEDRLIMKSHRQHGERASMRRDESSFIQYAVFDPDLRDNAIEVAKEVFRQHRAKRLETEPMRLLDGYHPFNRKKAVKLLTRGGNMIELCHELRTPFVNWVIKNQILSFKRYEISWVYRRAIGHLTPNRFLQGDFDIIGGAPAVTVAETIKVVMDIATRFFHSDAFDIRLNHGQALEAIWSWVGVEGELRQKVAELLSLLGSSCPQSASRKSLWGVIRRQLLQDLKLTEVVLDRIQTADLRFCGSAHQAIARLRGAIYPVADNHTRKALEELSALLSYLRIWKIERHVCLDVLMPPEESYYRGLFFQIYLIKENNHSSVSERTLLALGGCYDHLLQQLWDHEYKLNPPGAVGVSLALEKILQNDLRNEPSFSVLVCSRGGGGLLEERMELVAELWQENMKAEFVPLSEPSLTLQYEYAYEHDIKCLVILTEAGLSQTGLVKVRHLEMKKEKEVKREELIKFLKEAISTQFRNLSLWS